MADLVDTSDSDEDVVVLYAYQRRRKRKRRHDMWVHDLWTERGMHGEYHHLVRSLFAYEDKFHQYFRMTPQIFNELHELIKDDIRKQNTYFRRAIGTEERLAICLRYM